MPDVCPWCLSVAVVAVRVAVILRPVDLGSSAAGRAACAVRLSGAAPLGAVDEQRLRVGGQFVQLGLERVGVVLDETCQRIAFLLGRGAPAYPMAARLRLVHALG